MSWILCLFSCDGQLDDVEFGAGEYQGRIVIVPDIQYYTNDESRYIYLDAIVNCCQENQDKISFLLQTGDVTNNNQPWQWDNGFNLFFSRIPKTIPYVFCLGNHDYGHDGLSAKRESNFPIELSPICDIEMPSRKWDNYLKYVTLDNIKMAVLSLEFAPRNEVLEWANKVIKENDNIPIIILTHAFLNNSGQLFDATDSSCDNQWSQKQYSMGNDYINDSKEIFEKIVFNNTNVKLIICGHCISNNYIECLEKKNAKNGSVYCIMVNYQHYKDGGAGNIGVLDYYQGHFCLRSFNTINNRFGNINIKFDLKI